MKTIILSIIFSTFMLPQSLVNAQSPDWNPFPKILFKNLEELLLGAWEYDYSYNKEGVFSVDGEYYALNTYVPYRFEFSYSSKRRNKKIVQNQPWLYEHRQSSCLNKLQFWVDDKGMMRYPRLMSNKEDRDGNLQECKLKLLTRLEPHEPDYMIVNYISKGIMVISAYQGGKKDDFHVFVRETIE